MSISYISKSVMAAMAVHWLRNDTYVADARLLDGVHHGGEGAKRNIFIGAQKDRLVLRVPNFLLQARSDLVDVDGIVAEKNFLRFVDADHQALFGDLFDRTGVGDVDFDAGLQDRRRHHENDEQNEDDIHQGRDVDVGQSRLRASVSGGEGDRKRVGK